MFAKLRFLLLAATVSVALAHAGWCASKFTVMHGFTDGNDGEILWGSLLLDSQGNVYGTTYYGGANGGGTVFELSRCEKGTWTEDTLWSFNGTDGNASEAGLIFDTSGNLYGTTGLGGDYASGTAAPTPSASPSNSRHSPGICAGSGVYLPIGHLCH